MPVYTATVVLTDAAGNVRAVRSEDYRVVHHHCPRCGLLLRDFLNCLECGWRDIT